MFIESLLRDESLGTQHFRGGLAQNLPRHGWILVADLRELIPELLTAAGLNTRSWDVLHRALVAGSLNRLWLLHAWISGCYATCTAGFHLGGQTVARGFNGVRTVLTEELRDVLAENRGVRQHDVVRRVVFSSGLHDGLVLVDLFAQLLDRVDGLGKLAGVFLLEPGHVVGLLDQRVFKNAAVAVQQCGGFLAEVLKNLEALKTCGVEIPVPYLDLRLLALSQSRLLCLCLGISRRYLGQGDRLRRTECRCCLVIPRHH